MYPIDILSGSRSKTFLIALFISLIFLMNSIGVSTGDNEANLNSSIETRTSSRYTDPDPNWNNFAPNITLNSNPTPSIWNDGIDMIMLIVEVYDEDEDSNGSATTGGGISEVTADLSELGGSGNTPMYDDGNNGDLQAGDNIWTLNISTFASGGVYPIYFKVVDNGSAGNGGTKWNNTHGYSSDGMWQYSGWYVALNVFQINRAPIATTPPTIKFAEDGYNKSLDLDMYFNDPDGDPLTYTKDMMGESNISVIFTGSMVNITAKPNWFGQASFVITGNDTSTDPPQAFTDDLTVTVMVASINDMPMLNASEDWGVNADVAYADSDVFEGDEDDMWWINVSATDMDMYNAVPDDLTFDVENSGYLPTIFSIDAITGEFEFTPTNSEVGVYTVNVTVTDGIETDYKHVTFDIGNENDEPTLTKVWVGTNSVNIVDHKATLTGVLGATEDEEFKFTVEGSDDDIGDTLTYTLESGPPSMTRTFYGDMMANFTYTPDNDDAMMGYFQVNISVKDGGLRADDYVIINIFVINANDPPMIDEVDDVEPDSSKQEDRGVMKVGEHDNFTIKASDFDLDTLKVTADDTDVGIEDIGDGVFHISFNPSSVGNYTINISVTDGTTTDYYHFKWEVEKAKPPLPPNEPPSISITSMSGRTYRLGQTITIEGTISDPDGHEVEVLVEVLMPGSIAWGIYDDLPGIYDSIIYNGDGTWRYTYDSSSHDLGGILGALLDDIYEGTWTFAFIAEDEYGARSMPFQITVLFEADDEDKPDDEPFSLGFFPFDFLAFITLDIVIFLIVAGYYLIRQPRDRENRRRTRLPRASILAPPPTPPAVTFIKLDDPIPTTEPVQTQPIREEEPVPYLEPDKATENVQFISCSACNSWVPAYVYSCPDCGRQINDPRNEVDFKESAKNDSMDTIEVLPPDHIEEATDVQPILDICPSCGEGVPTNENKCWKCGQLFEPAKL